MTVVKYLWIFWRLMNMQWAFTPKNMVFVFFFITFTYFPESLQLLNRFIIRLSCNLYSNFKTWRVLQIQQIKTICCMKPAYLREFGSFTQTVNQARSNFIKHIRWDAKLIELSSPQNLSRVSLKEKNFF